MIPNILPIVSTLLFVINSMYFEMFVSVFISVLVTCSASNADWIPEFGGRDTIEEISIINYASPEKYIPIIKRHLENGDFENAGRTYFRFCIRSRQDILCSQDKSVQSLLPTIRQMLIRPMFSPYRHILKSILTTKIYLEVFKELKFETENDELEDPTWVAKYGMYGSDHMEPSHLWKQIRLDYINESIDELESVDELESKL